MAIPIPTRFLPNLLLAALFLLVGLTAGFVSGCLWQAERLRLVHVAAYACFALGVISILVVWRKGTYARTLKRLSFLSPRLLAVLLGGFLTVGVAAGAALSLCAPNSSFGADLARLPHRLLAQSP